MTMITLEDWAQRTYGHNAPHRNTLRRWAREAHIYPLPEKHGRQYFVHENARYVTYGAIAGETDFVSGTSLLSRIKQTRTSGSR